MRLGVSGLDQGDHVIRVAAAQVVLFVRLFEQLERELAHSLEHPQTRLLLRHAYQKVVVDE
jgi:hypothetical protein